MLHAVLGGVNDWGFPVRETALVTYRSALVDNLRYLPKAAALPFVLSLAICFLLLVFGLLPEPVNLTALTEWRREGALGDFARLALVLLLLYIPHVILAVSWIRLTLLGPRRAAPPLLPRPGLAHVRFFAHSVAATLAGFAVLLLGGLAVFAAQVGLSLLGDIPPVMMIGTLLGILAMAVVLVLAVGTTLRLALALPLPLVAPNETLAELWHLSSGQNLRLMIALLIILLPLLVIGMLGFGLAGGSLEAFWAQGDETPLFGGDGTALLFNFMGSTLFGLVCTAVIASFIAIAFQTILRWYPPGPAGAQTNARPDIQAQPFGG